MGVGRYVFIYITHTQTHITKPGFWSIRPKVFEGQGYEQESEEIVKRVLAHLYSSTAILRINNEPETGELNENRIIWWHKEKKVTQEKSKISVDNWLETSMNIDFNTTEHKEKNSLLTIQKYQYWALAM